MEYVCEVRGGETWFRFETETEAEQESILMDHQVAKHFRPAQEKAIETYKPTTTVYIEQNIGLKAHIQREMPLFLTLRDSAGEGLVTAMLPPGGRDDPDFKIFIVGKSNHDPYPEHETEIQDLGVHIGLTLDREHCVPYRK